MSDPAWSQRGLVPGTPHHLLVSADKNCSRTDAVAPNQAMDHRRQKTRAASAPAGPGKSHSDVVNPHATTGLPYKRGGRSFTVNADQDSPSPPQASCAGAQYQRRHSFSRTHLSQAMHTVSQRQVNQDPNVTWRLSRGLAPVSLGGTPADMLHLGIGSQFNDQRVFNVGQRAAMFRGPHAFVPDGDHNFAQSHGLDAGSLEMRRLQLAERISNGYPGEPRYCSRPSARTYARHRSI
ncbi:hypothetical protein EV356DRAFT_529607 [Viridothelium virens]|uniref:Uncharacterized protein n=1 Tax=Viridothelium virens TaxID=1048519 RepID=A0A6A6HJR4_VIRVR|nr:hypothetical protein EV356DRAFT_529607 [Viridothelium virens]